MERLTKATDDLTFLCDHLRRETKFDAQRVKDIHDRLAAYEDTGLPPDTCAEYKKFEDELVRSGMTFQQALDLLEAHRDGRCVVLPAPAKEGGEKPDCFYNDNCGLWCLGMATTGDDEPIDRCKACWYCENGDYADEDEEARHV